MPYACSINFGDGDRWTRNVIAWFAGESLLAIKSKWRAGHAATNRYG